MYEQHANYSNYGDGNLDPDLLKRHYALIERSQFRGPVWDKFAREGPPKDFFQPTKRMRDAYPEKFFDSGVHDVKQPWYPQLASPFAFLPGKD